MCDFPSWIIDDNGKAWWLTDKDIERHYENLGKEIDWRDNVGHHAIKKILGIDGEHKEGFDNLPKGLISDIRSGKMTKMMNAGGYKEIHLNKNDQLHCDDGPAVMFSDGTEEWYQNGKRHRDDGPAIIWSDGIQKWYKNGEFIKKEN